MPADAKAKGELLIDAIHRAMASDMLDEFLTAYVRKLNEGAVMVDAVRAALEELGL